MKALENRILKDGLVLEGEILKVDNFLNHQMDVVLLDEMGKELKSLFNDCGINKILTIESSGIGIAVMAAKYFDNCPVVFAKKFKAKNTGNDVYECNEKSYTKNTEYTVRVAKKYLTSEDNVLIVDDFLANGEALNALINICQQAQVQILGVGAVVCKAYQPGEKRIKDMGVHLECLARVKAMHDDGTIEFCED